MTSETSKYISPSRIIDLASAFFDSCLLFTATDLGIFAELDRRASADAGTLAHALNLDPRGARLILDGCVAVGLLTKEHDDQYRNSPEAALFLVPGKPSDLSAALRYNRDVYDAWGKLGQFARTGEPVEAPALHLGMDDARTRVFVHSMHSKAMGMAPGLLPLLDLSGRKRLLDVGCGPGTFSVLLSKKYPELTSQLLDLPPILDIASEMIATQGATDDRIQMIPGDYHTTPFPGGNDVVFLFGMLHQESVEAIGDLLQRAWESLVDGGVLYITDMMTDSTRTAPKFSALFAVNMALTKEQGWVFSDVDLKGWAHAAGFREVSVRPLPPPMPHWLAVATK